MSTQDKMERILKQIHVLLSKGPALANNPDKVVVDKKEVLAAFEQLNLAVHEMLEEYEATEQSRALAQQKTEEKGKATVRKISQQVEDVYAASLVYTDDALQQIWQIMTDAMEGCQKICQTMDEKLTEERRKVKEDQLQLREQLQDFTDTKYYLQMIEENRRQREKDHQERRKEKYIENEGHHYPLSGRPEIKVDPAYAAQSGEWAEATGPVVIRSEEILGKAAEKQTAEGVSPESEGSQGNYDRPEIRVNLDAEYFKWKQEEYNTLHGEGTAKDPEQAKFLTEIRKDIKNLISKR